MKGPKNPSLHSPHFNFTTSSCSLWLQAVGKSRWLLAGEAFGIEHATPAQQGPLRGLASRDTNDFLESYLVPRH